MVRTAETFALERAQPRRASQARARNPAPKDAPRYVHACADDRWRIATWPLAGGRGAVAPFRCRSRRHAGECSDRWRRELFARMQAGAMAGAKRSEVCFATWTLAPEHHATPPNAPAAREWWSDANWSDFSSRMRRGTEILSRAIGAQLARLSKQLDRAGEGRLRYLWVIEWHASGVAHAHAIILSPILAADTRRERRERMALDSDTRPCARWLAAIGEDHPFGDELGLTCARSEGAVQSYVCKLASRLGGELAKGQGAASASRHQRTHGSSRGFLAPKRKPAPGRTGTLMRRDGSFVRWDSLTWKAEGLAVSVFREDVRAVAFSPGDYCTALGLLPHAWETAPRWVVAFAASDQAPAANGPHFRARRPVARAHARGPPRTLG